MRSISIKIFLWFFLAMILVNIASIISVEITHTELLRSRPPSSSRFFEPVRDALGIYAQSAAEIFDRDGQAALAAYMDRIERATAIHAVLFNDRGNELSGRAIPGGAVELAKRADKSGATEVQSHGKTRLIAQDAQAADGSRYTLVAEIPVNGRGFLSGPPYQRGSIDLPPLHVLTPRLVAVLLTGGILCYWLARNFTAPVIKLRATTQELANGNLAARVGNAMGQRRDELAHLGHDFDRMAEHIQTLVNAQRRLLGDISHELRSPLARLRVALELARQCAGQDESKKLDRIEREAENINEMVGQLLTLSRIECNTDGVGNSTIDLAEIVREVADDADFEARSRKRTVRVVECEECATTGSVELLRSSIENVLRNAVRYTAEGTEVEIGLQCETEGEQPFAVITVRDHGPGVPEHAITDIFRPFYRVADARDRQTGGTGLGLAITARGIQLHGGTVKAANASSGGLIVTIRLPITFL